MRIFAFGFGNQIYSIHESRFPIIERSRVHTISHVRETHNVTCVRASGVKKKRNGERRNNKKSWFLFFYFTFSNENNSVVFLKKTKNLILENLKKYGCVIEIYYLISNNIIIIIIIIIIYRYRNFKCLNRILMNHFLFPDHN